MHFGIIFVLFLVSTASGFTLSDVFGSKILGGEKAEFHPPYQVSIQKKKPLSLWTGSKNYSHICGGSIMNENYFLTAAHCVENVTDFSTYSVQAGSLNIKDELQGSRHPILSCQVHEKYVPLNTSDIALCKVKIPFVFDKNIDKIGIKKDFVGGGVNCTLTGWGSLSPIRWLPVPLYTVFAYPPDLQKQDMVTITNEECSKKLRNGRKVGDTEICASSGIFKGPCAGDSGGPLVCDGVQVGVVSYGPTICGSGAPDVFTRVSYFYDWIHTNMFLNSLEMPSVSAGVASIVESIPEAFAGV